LFFCNGPSTFLASALSLHDALPISRPLQPVYMWNKVNFCRQKVDGGPPILSEQIVLRWDHVADTAFCPVAAFLVDTSSSTTIRQDRKSTRLNSSHVKISYAVFCLKK